MDNNLTDERNVNSGIPDTLYHYCTSSTFASIIKNKAIWLSSLSLSNDSMEGRLVTQTFDRILAKENINYEVKYRIKEALIQAENYCDGLGFCLSEWPDQLSQWRGYAADGQGFSIGFSKKYFDLSPKAEEIKQSSYFLGKVLYREHEHESALIKTYDSIKELIDGDKLVLPQINVLSLHNEEYLNHRKLEFTESFLKLWNEVFTTFPVNYLLKNKAFEEENEWRLISYLFSPIDDKSLHRAAGNRLIPYREYTLTSQDSAIINNVVIGPKNITPINTIEKFLECNEFPSVKVMKSIASYR